MYLDAIEGGRVEEVLVEDGAIENPGGDGVVAERGLLEELLAHAILRESGRQQLGRDAMRAR